jgi:hypothetical protein
MEIEIIAEGLHGGNGGRLPVRQIKPRPHPVAQALDGDAEEMVEEFSALAEDAAEGFRHRKHELPVRHLEAEDSGNPVAGLTDFALMATGAEVPRLAGEGEEPLVSAVGALQPSESGGEVAAAVELANDVNGVLAKRTVDGAVAFFVPGHEVRPAVMDELTPSMQSGFARFSCC